MKLENCRSCGLCKANCPIYNATLRETIGARGRAILLKKDYASDIFYACSLCKSCDSECPSGIELSKEIRHIRERMIKEGKETEANKAMIENIRKYGNPFGKMEKGVFPEKLYCC